MITFEIHITTQKLSEQELPAFVDFCAKIEAKPILIELSHGKSTQQPMISKVVKCDGKASLEFILEDLKNLFVANSFSVERTKIEVPVKYHSATKGFYPALSKTYFEWHGKVIVSDTKSMQALAEKFGGKLSKNSLKNEANRKFITLRDFDGEASIMSRIQALKTALAEVKAPVLKEELEFCIYDSNLQLDAGWIN